MSDPSRPGDQSPPPNLPVQPLNIGIQGRPISSTPPTKGDSYVWDGKQWSPGTSIATPILVAEAGGSILGGTTSGTYLCNMDSTPKVPGTSGNQVLSLWIHDSSLDTSLNTVSGWKVQYRVKVVYTTNNVAPGTQLEWGMIQVTSIGGAPGGYTETIAGSFVNPTVSSPVLSAVALTEVIGGWADFGAANNVTSNAVYNLGVFQSGTAAANSAIRWRMGLYRRWYPLS